MKAFTNLFVAHYKQFVRDKTALFFTFLFPIIFVLVFGWAFGGSELRTFDIGMVREEESPYADAISAGLKAITVEDKGKLKDVFDVREGDLNTELDSLRKGDIDAVIVVPAGFSAGIAGGQTMALDVYHDPSQTSTSQILLPLLQQVIDQTDRALPGGRPALIGLQEHTIQSHKLRVIDFLVPGILGMQIMFTGIYGCLPVIQQRQAHILKRLGCTPLRRSTMVISELAFRMILVLATTAMIIAVARLAFDVQMVGNWGMLCGIAALGTVAFVCLGYLIAAFVRTEQGAEPIINIVTFPMMFLSGTFFPVENFPAWLGPVVKALPLTYLGDALRQIMVDGTPLYPMTTDIIVLVGWMVVTLLVTIRFFRWD